MTTLPPPEDSEDVLAYLEAQLSDVEIPTDVENVKEVSSPDLGEQLAALDRQLSQMGELLHPRTQEGRDLHSKRAALLVEMRNRGLR
jgi:hypothetical protein